MTKEVIREPKRLTLYLAIGMENQPHFSKKVKIVITTGGSVSISERIIDDTCLGFFLFIMQ